MADKADIGAITLRVSSAEEELGKAYAIKLGTPIPNFITDIYKNRRGKWTGVRIWRYVDLGTCRVVDCFVSDRNNEIIEDFDSIKIQVKQVNHTNGFVIKKNKESNAVVSLGEDARVEDYYGSRE